MTTRICFLLALSFAIPPVAAQPISAVRLLDEVEARRIERMQGVQNYAAVVKVNVSGAYAEEFQPAVEYYERALVRTEDGQEEPADVFRLVPPTELATRTAEREQEPTAQERSGGLADVLDVITGQARSSAREGSVLEDLEVLADAASERFRRSTDTDEDTNADALAGLDHVALVREHLTSIREGVEPGFDGPATLTELVASGFEAELDVDEAGSRYVANRITLWIDPEALVVVGMKIEGQRQRVTIRADPVPFFVQGYYSHFQSPPGSSLYEPGCSVQEFNIGGEASYVGVTMRRIVEVNEGLPSRTKQHEWIADAIDDTSFTCL